MTKVDVIIPVYNEEEELAPNVTRLHDFLKDNLRQEWNIVIADNGSTDRTLSIAQELSRKYLRVKYMHMPEKGRGRALKKAFLDSKADIVSFMDVDLSTDISFFPPLVDAIDKEKYHIAIGSRLMKQSRGRSSLKRSHNSKTLS